MGLPSRAGADGLCFLPKVEVALHSGGANKPPPRAPSAARNERRFQPNFRFMPSFLPRFLLNYLSADGVGGPTTSALPTISISESPGIHSTATQARDGALPGEK